MDFRAFYAENSFTLLQRGDANWDYFLMEQTASCPAVVVALAKPGSGADDSFFCRPADFNRLRGGQCR